MISLRSGETHDWVRWRFINKHEELGDFGERLWSHIFRGCGLRYIKLADLPAMNGRGPSLQGDSDETLPDFEISGQQRRAYVDSKCKSGPVMFYKANEMRQGVDTRCWESYKTISEIHRQKCILAIAEVFTLCDKQQPSNREWSGALLMQTLWRLGPPIKGFSTMDDMVLWPRSRFAEIVPGTSPLRFYGLGTGQVEVDAELKERILRVLTAPEVIQGRFV